MKDPLIQNILQCIDEAGYPDSQAFAQKAGIRIDTLNKWIEGKSRPSKKSLEKLATALACSVEDLTAEEKEKPGVQDSPQQDRTIEKLKKVIQLQARLIEKYEQLLAHRHR